MQEKIYKIGRNPDNDIVINDPKVSRYHCTLTQISTHTYMIEDMDSAGGTYINDIKTKRSIVTQNEVIRLSNHIFDWASLSAPKAQVPIQIQTPKPPVIEEKPKEENDFTEEFLKLKEVYESYRNAKLAIMKGGTIKSTAIRAGLAFIPVIGVPLGMILSSNSTSMQEKMMALTETFKINYVCPKCKNFLQDLPWESLANKKKCHCKAIWVKDN